MSAIPKLDVVGVGLNATDTLIPVHHYPAALALSAASLALLLLCGITLYRTTRFH